MLWLADAIEAIRDFMNLGGPVLRAIAVTIFVMWALIIERMIFFRTSMKQMSRDIYNQWESRPERQSWNAKQIRELLISRFSVPFYFGGTSLLIVITVTMDTVAQVQSHLLAHQYEGLIKKAKLRGRRR